MNINYLKQFLSLMGKDRKRLPFMLFLYLLSSLLDIIGIGLIAPFVELFSNSVSDSFLLRTLKKIFPHHTQYDNVIIIGSALLLIFIFKTIASIFINKVNISFSTQQDASLRAKLMKKYQNMPYDQYINCNSADLIQRIRVQVGELVYNGFIPLFRLLSESIVSLVVLAFLFYTSPFAMLLLTGLILLLLIIYDSVIKKQVTQAGRDSALHGAQLVKAIQESLGGFKEIKVLGIQKYFKDIVDKSVLAYSKSQERMLFLTFIPRYLLELVVVIFMVIYPLILIGLNQDLDNIFATLGVFGVAAIRIIPSTNIIVQALTTLRYTKPAVEAVHDDLVGTEDNILIDDLERIVQDFKSLKLEKVYYRYPRTTNWALSNINFEINSGDSVGFIGSSGSGKTTLIDVILNLLKPQQGQIFFNGMEIATNPVRVDQNFAYLPQQIFILDDTLRRNVAMGVEDSQIDDDRVFESLANANLSSVLERLPEKLDTVLGEHGVRISGGQRQRVALARAFYHNRNILVMDESTSALDTETESEIVENIKMLRGQKTLIIIAHRLSTLKHCDRIYSLEKGQIFLEDVGKVIGGIKP